MQPLGSLCVNSFNITQTWTETRKMESNENDQNGIEETDTIQENSKKIKMEEESSISDEFVEQCAYIIPTINNVDKSNQMMNTYNECTSPRRFLCNALTDKYRKVKEEYATEYAELKEICQSLEDTCYMYKREAQVMRRNTQVMLSKRRAQDYLITLAAMEWQERLRLIVLQNKRERRQALLSKLQLLLESDVDNNNNNNTSSNSNIIENDSCGDENSKTDIMETVMSSSARDAELQCESESSEQSNDLPHLSQQSIETLNNFLSDLAEEEDCLTTICIHRPVFTHTSRKYLPSSVTDTVMAPRETDNEEEKELYQEQEENTMLENTKWKSMERKAATTSSSSATIEHKGYFAFFGGATVENLSAKPYSTFASNIYRLGRAAWENELNLQLVTCELSENNCVSHANMEQVNNTSRKTSFATMQSTNFTDGSMSNRYSKDYTMTSNKSSSSSSNKFNVDEIDNKIHWAMRTKYKAAKSKMTDATNDESLFLQLPEVGHDDDSNKDDDNLFISGSSMRNARRSSSANEEELSEEKDSHTKSKEAVSVLHCVAYAEPLLSTISNNLSLEEIRIQEEYQTEIERQRKERRELIHDIKAKFRETQRAPLKSRINLLKSEQHVLIKTLRDGGVRIVEIRWTVPCNSTPHKIISDCNNNNNNNNKNNNNAAKNDDHNVCVEGNIITNTLVNNLTGKIECELNAPCEEWRSNSAARHLFEPASVVTECDKSLTWSCTAETTEQFQESNNNVNHINEEKEEARHASFTNGKERESAQVLHVLDHHLVININENNIKFNNNNNNTNMEKKKNTNASNRFSSDTANSIFTTSSASTRSTHFFDKEEEEEEEEEEQQEKEEPEEEEENELEKKYNYGKEKETHESDKCVIFPNTITTATTTQCKNNTGRVTVNRLSMRATQLNDEIRASSELRSAIPLCRIKERNSILQMSNNNNNNNKNSTTYNQDNFSAPEVRCTVHNKLIARNAANREKEGESFSIDLTSNVKKSVTTVLTHSLCVCDNVFMEAQSNVNECKYTCNTLPICSTVNASITFSGQAAQTRRKMAEEREEQVKELWQLREELARVEENNFIQEHELEQLEKAQAEEQAKRESRLSEASSKLSEQKSLLHSFKHERKKWTCILQQYERKLKHCIMTSQQHKQVDEETKSEQHEHEYNQEHEEEEEEQYECQH